MATETQHPTQPTLALLGPLRNGADVTPNDSVDLTFVTRQIFIGGAGNMVVDLAGNGATITFNGLQAGQTLDIAAKRIRATNTTATLIRALW